MSRKYRTIAAFVAACLAVGMNAQAENLLLKRSDGTTLTQIPLLTSNGCAVAGNGDIEVRPQPTAGASGDGWCPEGGGNPPSFPTGLAVSPLTINPNESVTAIWTSLGATSCTGSATVGGVGASVAGWSGARATSQASPGLSLTLGTTGLHVFMITCANAAGATTSTALTVTVREVGPTGCETHPPSFGLTRQSSMTDTLFLQGNDEHTNGTLAITSYNVISGPWPARTGNGTIVIGAGKYVALQFNTGVVSSTNYGGTAGSPNRYGTLQNIVPAAYPGSVLFAVSTCPGAFENADLPESNIKCRLQTQGNQTWSYGVGVTDPFTCRLAENTNYYLNATYVEYATGQSNCVGEPLSGSNPTTCHWFVQPR